MIRPRARAYYRQRFRTADAAVQRGVLFDVAGGDR
jgi:hypothetical protein